MAVVELKYPRNGKGAVNRLEMNCSLGPDNDQRDLDHKNKRIKDHATEI
jgi:hypothetical protein